jgi:hypothetical protein
MHDRPDHEVTMESALLGSLAFHGHRRTRSAAPWSGSLCMEPPSALLRLAEVRAGLELVQQGAPRSISAASR